MTIDINQFWSLLTESRLVNVSQTQTLFTGFTSDNSIPKTPESLARYLVDQKAISAYQAKIIAAGHSGPFQYGTYTVVDRIETGFLKDNFKARHTKTGFAVLLEFIPGTESGHLYQWRQIEELVEKTCQLQHANVVETFEAVAAPDYRFVVSQLPNGSTLAEKLPRKARLPWQKACEVLAQVAAALDQFHRIGVIHNSVSPRTTWLKKNGLVQLRMNYLPDSEFESPLPRHQGSESKFDYLAPEAFETGQQTPASDLYSLGCTLYRAIAGHPPFVDADPESKQQLHLTQSPGELTKYGMPDQLDSLIRKLMAKRPSERPSSAVEVSNLLALLSGKADQLKSKSPPTTKLELTYRNSLKPFLPGSGAVIDKLPEIATRVESGDSTIAESPTKKLSDERRGRIQAAALAAQKRKKSRWKLPATIAASLLALAGVIGILAMNADRIVVTKLNPEKSSPAASLKTDTPPIVPADPAEDSIDLAELDPELRPTVFQKLIDDDNQSIWETPTNGSPIRFSHLPVAPKIVFVFRPSDLVNMDEGRRLIKSLGPSFESRVEDFQTLSGIDLAHIDQLIISLHTNEQFEYDPYFIVRTKQPLEPERLIQNWNRPVKRQLENRQEIWESSKGPTAYYILRKNADSNDSQTEDVTEANQVTRFACGNKDLIESVALNSGATALSGAIRNLVDWSDRDRHVNILFLRNSLFNDEGQKLMGKNLRPFNRELNIMLPDEVRGGLLSLHLDSGNYLELILDSSVDLKATDLKKRMTDGFQKQRDRLLQFVASIPPTPYWDKVRIRYGAMLANFYRSLRWDVEHGQVVANCWLPRMAAHNLLAASELVVSFASGASFATATTIAMPQSLDELLATRRDLNISNPPDLNVLLADLESEIEDDFGKLPFPFNIQLLGSDLEAEGITKNQRPGELVMNQKTIAEILTLVMTSANPKKDITGPNDPECKLIWVVAEDPENPGTKAILVTTRAAAAAKSYELPPAFRTE